ncbi:MAG: V-type ATP synthase subunit D [Candidatus Omnitrophica bacterium]|nr:V-type ATP synthase subunit D [Candidatus Omnitrophota bacterium]
MAKVKLIKGELKKQRDALAQYERFLPTLQLKKQQLQLEITRQLGLLQEKNNLESAKIKAATAWAGLFAAKEMDFEPWLKPQKISTSVKNIAGVGLEIFENAEFKSAEYDLFSAPLWVDTAIEALRTIVALRQETRLIERGLEVLRQELRVTSQRVNLFEKVKIPEAEEAIRRIKIYIGDQMSNAVGRSKIAKRKIEGVVLELFPAS